MAVYANGRDELLELPVRELMTRNATYQFVLVYAVSSDVKRHRAADVTAALEGGALTVGPESGLPLHRFPLDRTAEAHAAVESGAVGKVLVDLA